MTHPLIYVNGCSYSDENYANGLMHQSTYAHYYGKLVNGYVISRARAGSCNRRIIRTTAHDMVEQRRLNPTQQIVAIIQLTFEIRDELWMDEIEQTMDPCESHFRTTQFSQMLDWREQLLTNKKISPAQRFLQKWHEGRAFFYNSYAERINLLLDVLFLTKLLDSLNVEYLIFQGPIAEKLDKEYLKDFFLTEITNPCVLDFESFGFCNWCDVHGFDPIHPSEPGRIGHYKPDAHQAFAEEFLVKIL